MTAHRRFALPGDERVRDRLRAFHAADGLLSRAVAVTADHLVPPAVAGLAVATAALAARAPAERPRLLLALGAASAAYAATVALKPLVARTPPYPEGRPARELPSVLPEGPGAFCAGLAAGTRRVSRPLALAAVGVAAVDGAAQVAAGSHWPSDLLAAWALGTLAGGVAVRAAPPLRPHADA